MAKVIKFVGRTTDQKGKTLWEILGSLKNFGVGRIVARSMFERYPEPSFIKIVKVETVADEGKIEENRKVRVWVEKTFRGRKYPGLCQIYSVSYKPDYKLIPKNMEAEYCKVDKPHENFDKVLPRSAEMPPLMKEFIIADCERRGVQPPKELRVTLGYHTGPNRTTKIESEETKANIEFPVGLGKPVSPSLYKGINIDS